MIWGIVVDNYVASMLVQVSLSFRGAFVFLHGGKNRPFEKRGESLFIAASPHPWMNFKDVYVMRRVSAQEVPFRGRVDTAPHMRVKYSQTPILGA